MPNKKKQSKYDQDYEVAFRIEATKRSRYMTSKILASKILDTSFPSKKAVTRKIWKDLFAE